MRKVRVLGTGSFMPGEAIPFDDIEKVIGELLEAPEKIRKWAKNAKMVMKEMLGMEYYHYAIDPKTGKFFEDNVTMATKAALEALKMARLVPQDVDLIIYGSAMMNQMPTPSTRIQEKLGIDTCSELSIHANCTSAYKALLLGHELLSSGRYNTALILSSNISSSVIRADFYNQKIVKKEELFLRWFLCDGAGAIVLKAEENPGAGIYIEDTYMESIGGNKPSMMYDGRPAYVMNPLDEYASGAHHFAQLYNHLQSGPVFQEPDGSVFSKGLKRMIRKHQINLQGLKFFQVNLPAKHVMDYIGEECVQLGIPRETFYSKLSSMGYAGPPMAFICLDKILREEQLSRNDLIFSFVTEVSKFLQAGFTLRVQ